MLDTTHPVVLFDGVCNLCNASVQWLLERDRAGSLRYASLQSAVARELLSEHLSDDEIEAIPDAIVLIDGAGVHTSSTAALRIAGKLGLPWKAFVVFLAVPRGLRDSLYRWVARNRYRWFGHRDACMVPTPGVAERFLDAGEPRAPIAARDPAERGARSSSSADPTGPTNTRSSGGPGTSP
ncbi:MAG: thiol-disulfide oxidoreductase DCC family protein [Gemmatimonadota bacterium]|jgi:predicted DCC family thiol-disulfide oxidoreductase YuxK